MRIFPPLAAVLLFAAATVAGPDSSESVETETVVKAPPPSGARSVDAEAAEAVRMRYSRQIRNGRRLYQGGLFTALGGLGIGLLSPEQLPAPVLLGSLAFMSGELMMGIGADRLNHFAKTVPGHVDPGSGWGYYGAAWGLKMGGSLWLSYLILTSFEFAGPRPVLLPYIDMTWEDAALPLLTIATGVLCDGVALYKFHARQKAARSTLTSGLSWSPTLRRDSEGAFQAGLSLTLALHPL